jgi:hypothetical protein
MEPKFERDTGSMHLPAVCHPDSSKAEVKGIRFTIRNRAVDINKTGCPILAQQGWDQKGLGSNENGCPMSRF